MIFITSIPLNGATSVQVSSLHLHKLLVWDVTQPTATLSLVPTCGEWGRFTVAPGLWCWHCLSAPVPHTHHSSRARLNPSEFAAAHTSCGEKGWTSSMGQQSTMGRSHLVTQISYTWALPKITVTTHMLKMLQQLTWMQSLLCFFHIIPLQPFTTVFVCFTTAQVHKRRTGKTEWGVLLCILIACWHRGGTRSLLEGHTMNTQYHQPTTEQKYK